MNRLSGVLPRMRLQAFTSAFVAMKPRRLIPLLFGVALFCFLSIQYWDIPVVYFCRFNLSRIEPLFGTITKAGHGTWYYIGLILLAGYFWYIKSNHSNCLKCIFIFTSILLSGLANSLLKFVFGRYRPDELLSHSLYGFTFFSIEANLTSFPSGHANLITALTLSLYFIFPRFLYIWLTISLLIIASRVIICDHYLSDVVFGSYLAVMITLYVKNIYQDNGLLTFGKETSWIL